MQQQYSSKTYLVHIGFQPKNQQPSIALGLEDVCNFMVVLVFHAIQSFHANHTSEARQQAEQSEQQRITSDRMTTYILSLISNHSCASCVGNVERRLEYLRSD
jgi:hypothetical protein